MTARSSFLRVITSLRRRWGRDVKFNITPTITSFSLLFGKLKQGPERWDLQWLQNSNKKYDYLLGLGFFAEFALTLGLLLS